MNRWGNLVTQLTNSAIKRPTDSRYLKRSEIPTLDGDLVANGLSILLRNAEKCLEKTTNIAITGEYGRGNNRQTKECIARPQAQNPGRATIQGHSTNRNPTRATCKFPTDYAIGKNAKSGGQNGGGYRDDLRLSEKMQITRSFQRPLRVGR